MLGLSLCHFEEIPYSSDSRYSACNAGDSGSLPGWEDPLDWEGQPTPVFCLENSMDGLWGRKESDMTEQLYTPGASD